jgi:hypothetical protein
MEYNKKVGIILMVASPVVAIISFFSSNCDCNLNNPDLRFLAVIMYGRFHLQLFSDDSYPANYFIDIDTKYILFLCIVTLAFGLLYYLGVLSAPRKRASEQAVNTDNKQPK